MDANDYFRRGSQLHNMGHYAAAISDFEKVVEMVPNSFEAWWALASAYMLQGNKIELRHAYHKANSFKMKAVDAYEKAAKIDPTDSRAAKAREIAQTLIAASEERRKLGMI